MDLGKCMCCGSNSVVLKKMTFRNGVVHYPRFCMNCKTKLSYVSKVFAEKYMLANGDVDELKTSRQKYGEGIPECEVCGAEGTELHHWAPSHLFSDSEDWPKSHLCVKCHTKWHSIVTPNMSHHNHSDDKNPQDHMSSLLSRRNMLRSRLNR